MKDVTKYLENNTQTERVVNKAYDELLDYKWYDDEE